MAISPCQLKSGRFGLARAWVLEIRQLTQFKLVSLAYFAKTDVIGLFLTFFF
jgi:hypothetical protein